jgi:hypothetical protein
MRVRVNLKVTGELVAPAGAGATPIREPVEMTARFEFEEVPTAGSTVAGAAEVRRSFHHASATMRCGDATTQTALAADARDLLVARRGTTAIPYLADGFLTGEESDLLDTPFDSLLLDALIPQTPLAVGQAWDIPADLTAGLLAIDTVESGGIEARLAEVADGRATITIAGVIDGAVDGVPTHLTLDGSFTVGASRAASADDEAAESLPYELLDRVAEISAVIRERRQASHVAPGFEVEARLQITRTSSQLGMETAVTDTDRSPAPEPATSPKAEAGAVPASRRRGAGVPGQVWRRDPQGRFDLVHDTRWRCVEDGPHGLVMRLVDHGALVGQCSITTLPPAAHAALPDRVEVQRDIERSLAGQIVRIDAVEEADRADGVRVVRLASSGTAGQLPFRWVHYVLAAADGSRTSVTFMFEESMQERFGTADRPLVESLRLPQAGEAPPRQSQPGPTAAVPGNDQQPTR